MAWTNKGIDENLLGFILGNELGRFEVEVLGITSALEVIAKMCVRDYTCMSGIDLRQDVASVSFRNETLHHELGDTKFRRGFGFLHPPLCV
jgi:hypothetical protein